MFCLLSVLVFLGGKEVHGAESLNALSGARRHQDQQLEMLHSQALKQPDVLSSTPLEQNDTLVFAKEAPCVAVHVVEWRGASEFPWLPDTPPIVGHCVGGEGLGRFRHWVAEQFIARGYLTTQVSIPQQDLANGRLIVDVIAGRIGSIREHPDSIGWTRPVFPGVKGALLNVRDLDQALENVRRLPGQAVTAFDLVPGSGLGESDILIQHPKDADRVMGMLTADNSGIDATGRNQLGVIMAIDSPLWLYDQFLLTYNSDAEFGNHTLGSSSKSAAWNVPFGYALFSLGASEWESKQQLLKDGDGNGIPLTSKTRRFDAGISAVAYRSSHSKGTFNSRLIRRLDQSWVSSTELLQLHRDITSYEFSIAHREKLSRGILDFELGLRGSLPGMSSSPGAIYEKQDWKGRYRIFTAKASAGTTFLVGEKTLGYQSTASFQYSPVPVPSTEYLQIGGRYTVRGFDGNTTLAGPGGWTWRNEVAMAAPLGSQVYTALDAAEVSSAASQQPGGRMLIGGAIGLRGNLNSFGYDASLGLPLKKPGYLQSRMPTLDFSITSRF
ncbi:ShlB/FhaC/HecB family hemolysin secretion/activation protein [Pseudomonas sp. CVAP|uniref:ShlB/FhaC/HecB family hemolysin secretion/activation protein n=1 Tax=Pseudomonas sp. CVAP\|nr:ShlB/FhaC/HecB family hemolysin secretion/activation protein [Pseudomonas sp. CVAP\